MPLVTAVLACIAGQFAVGLFALFVQRWPGASRFVYAASCAISLLALAGAVLGLVAAPGAQSAAILPLGLPWLGAHFRVDALAAFFLVVVNLGGVTASLYGIGHGQHEASPGRILPLFPAFLGGMNLVVLADDAFTFLFSWELMSLLSWALVMSHHRSGDNRRAGYIYLTMASFGTLALLMAFGLLAGAEGNYLFGAMRQAPHAPFVVAIVVAFVLLGAGSKAGLVPLHVWLPLAHPAAPSHVSALMSGAMTKVAVYACIRVLFDLVGPPASWHALVVLMLGGATAALGVLYALMQNDLKRLLAYSTVENIGIVFIGLGLALAFEANGMRAAAALALAAALFHVLNHSIFKSLLFFGAGAVLSATGQRDMDRLGGLISRMPHTALVFLVGCVAISALPPLNGFVSEWLMFQAILQSPELPHWGLKFVVPAVGGLLALSAALAAACFVKAFGITFLGRARTPAAVAAEETDSFSLAAMTLLGVLCLLAGILPGFVIDLVAPITHTLVGGSMPRQGDVAWLSIVPIGEARSSYNGLLVFVFIALSAPFAAVMIHRFASHALRRGPAWDCGFPDASPATQYTAGSVAQPIRRVFGATVFGAREHVVLPRPGDLAPAHIEVELHDPVWDVVYAPVGSVVGATADKLNRFQFLTIRRYLSLVFVALVALLLVLAVWQ